VGRGQRSWPSGRVPFAGACLAERTPATAAAGSQGPADETVSGRGSRLVMPFPLPVRRRARAAGHEDAAVRREHYADFGTRVHAITRHWTLVIDERAQTNNLCVRDPSGFHPDVCLTFIGPFGGYSQVPPLASATWAHSGAHAPRDHHVWQADGWCRQPPKRPCQFCHVTSAPRTLAVEGAD
jgi:hypothetical protein